MQLIDVIIGWTATLTIPTASFLGALAGAGLGLIAVLIGALFNAQLNRNRDSRLRAQDRRALATAIQAELMVLRASMWENAAEADRDEEARRGLDMLAPDPTQLVKVLDALLEDIGKLRLETITKVVTAHGVLPHFVDQLITLGCVLQPRRAEHDERRLILVPPQSRPIFAGACRGVADVLSAAIEALDREILY